MRPYLELLRLPGILRITAAQLAARVPLGMLSLAILLHVEMQADSYAVAGGVVALVSLGKAAVVPVTSRLTARFGVARTLVVAAAVNAAAMVALVAAPPALPLLLGLGLLIGGSEPPLMPVVRALYPRLVPQDRVPALFALDVTAQELIWIMGPVAAAGLAAAASPGSVLIACAVITLVGTLWFVASPQVREFRPPVNPLAFGRSLMHGTVALAMVASFLLMASFMSLEVGIIARFDGAGLFAGIALAAASVGSLVGGIALGHRRMAVPGLAAAIGIVALGTGLAGLVDAFPLLLLAMFLSGVGFAPALAAMYSMVSAVVAESAATEVFGWLTTAALVGAAAGTALGGVLSDVHGPAGAYLAAAILAVAATASPGVARLAGPVRGLSPSTGTAT
jgi:MFS family permease